MMTGFVDTEVNVEIGRFQGGKNRAGYSIRVTDRRSGRMVVDVELSMEQFAVALGGHAEGEARVPNDGFYGQWTRRIIIKTGWRRRGDDAAIAELEAAAVAMAGHLRRDGKDNITQTRPYHHNDGTSVHVDWTEPTEPERVVAATFTPAEAISYVNAMVKEGR